MSTTRHRGGSRSLAYQQDCDYLIKAILLGDLGVGKTTFFHTYIHGRCPAAGAAFPKTGTASGHKTISYHGKKVKLTVWDTAGESMAMMNRVTVVMRTTKMTMTHLFSSAY